MRGFIRFVVEWRIRRADPIHIRFNWCQLGNVQSLNDDQPSVNWPAKLPFNLTTPHSTDVTLNCLSTSVEARGLLSASVT